MKKRTDLFQNEDFIKDYKNVDKSFNKHSKSKTNIFPTYKQTLKNKNNSFSIRTKNK